MQASKSIVIFASYFPPHVGGVEQYSFNLARTLRDMGIRVAVVTCSEEGAEGISRLDSGIELFSLRSLDLVGRYPLPLPGSSAILMMRELERRDFRAVIVNNRFYPLSLVGLQYAQKIGVQPVLIEHGSAYLTFSNAVLDVPVKAYEHGVTALVKRYDPKFYAVSKKASEWLSTFSINCQGTIHNSIDVDSFRAQASQRDFRRELHLPASRPLVAFTGRINPEKGIFPFLACAKACTNADFLMAGAGTHEDEIRQAAPSNLHLLGRLSHSDIAALMMQSDVFCFPSRSEGLATSLLEAAAGEAYIVTSDVGGAFEVVPDPTLGTVIASNTNEQAFIDAIEAALANLAATHKSAQRCCAHVKRTLSWEKAAEDALRACGLA